MRRGVLATILVVMLGAQAAVLLLHSGTGALSGTASTGSVLDELIILINNGITWSSLDTRSIADVRDAVLPLAAGAALILVAVDWADRRRRARGADGTNGESTVAHAVDAPQQAGTNPAERWFVVTAGAVVVIAVLSTIQAASHDWSWGWVVRFGSGAALAWSLGRLVPAGGVRAALGGMMALGIVTLALCIAYRRSRGQIYFSWPVGALTPLAIAAAVWAAAGLVSAASLVRIWAQNKRLAVLSALTAALGCYVVAASERRAALVGLIAAIAFFGWTRLRLRLEPRTFRLASVGAAGVALLAAVGYTAVQLQRSDRVAAGSVAYRLVYWRMGLEMIAGAPSLGIGPDMTVLRLTNALAPLRDVSPHVYHGNFDPAFHNEWLQALVELGLPGGIFYLLLPAGTVMIARRHVATVALARVRPDGDGELARRVMAPPVVDSLSAAVVALCVADAASVTLRGPILPLYYWSMLGLLLASARSDARLEAGDAARQLEGGARPAVRRLPIVIAAMGGMLFAVAGGLDLVRAAAPVDRMAGPRLYAEKTVADRSASGIELAAQGRWQQSADALEPLARDMPGFYDVPARYADALIHLERREEASAVLDSVLHAAFRPHAPRANVLMARHFAGDTTEQLLCMQRALRHETARNAVGGAGVDGGLLTADVAEWLAPRVAHARQRASEPLALAAQDDAPELLRLEAYLLVEAGRLAEAIPLQRIAAEAYAALEQANHPYRRGERAEYDAFWMLADWRYAVDVRNYRGAFEAIRAAERYAVLGLRHERVWPPRPSEGFVFGEAMPVEFPDELRNLWRFSAKMQMVHGINENLDLRVYASLPRHLWMNEEALYREIGRLAAECVQEFKDVAAAERPPAFPALVETAKRYGHTRS